MKKTDQIKCLFGYHTYDEVWSVNERCDTQLTRKLTICITCRKSALWSILRNNGDLGCSREVTVVKEVGARFCIDTGYNTYRYMHLEKSSVQGKLIHLGLRNGTDYK